MRKKKESKRTAAQLSLDLYNWFHQRIYGSFKGTRFYLDNSVSREKNKILLAREGKEYVLGFEDLRERKEKFNLFVLVTEADSESVSSSLNRKISELRLAGTDYAEKGGSEKVIKANQYDKIFGRGFPKVEKGNVTFEGKDYSGVKINIPIANIPVGTQGGLSNNLFVYFDAEILSTIHNLSK